MAKLTLAFKDRKLKIFALSEAGGLVGRDPECLILIDSLAVEPQHARISCAGERFSIEPYNENTLVLVNDQEIATTHTLQEGDEIKIGKHTLSFSEEMAGTVLDPAAIRQRPASGWLQILTGSHLGRTIRLDKTFTRIGKADTQLAVVARRNDGFYVSHLQGQKTPCLNDKDIGEASLKLKDGDQISVGALKVQFFVDSDSTKNADADTPHAGDIEQRQFSRIPFDVSATLRRQQQQWETCLIDISLHGALVRVPADFTCEADESMRLTVHLEGGPDIQMDVSVAHHETEQVGLRCCDIDVDSITCLRRLVELNLGDPELLERELSALG